MARSIIKSLLLVCMLCPLAALADEFTIEPFCIEAGETKTVILHLEGSRLYINFQLDLYLPEGFSIATNARGKLLWEVNMDMQEEKGDHTITGSQLTDTEGHYRIIVESDQNYTFKKESGDILNIPIVASENVTSGEYVIRITNQTLTGEDRQGYDLDDKDCPFSAVGNDNVIVGDVNKDQSVTIADVTAMMNIILGKDNEEPFLYDHQAADMNNSGGVDAYDVTELVNVLLEK